MNNPMDTSKTSVEIVVTAQVSLQTLADILITAVEGGIGYWSQTVTYRWTEGPIHTYADIIEVDEDEDEEDHKHHKIDLEVIKRGIERCLSGAVKPSPSLREMIHRAVVEDDAGHVDSDAADVVVQAGLFSEIVYG